MLHMSAALGGAFPGVRVRSEKNEWSERKWVRSLPSAPILEVSNRYSTFNSLTPRKLEAADAGQPPHAARGLTRRGVVLGRVPKRAIVGGVYRQRAVTAPAARRPELHAVPANQHRLTLEQAVRRVRSVF